jgi:uncharacterized protein (DUF1330 family)
MSAYIVVQVDVKDPIRYEDYKRLVLPTLGAFGGRFLVRGGKTQTLEGNWAPQRFVIVEFPDGERAKAWWASDAYAPAKALRQATSVTQMILAEGLP